VNIQGRVELVELTNTEIYIKKEGVDIAVATPPRTRTDS